jgi:hypothetical protein
MEMPRFNKTVRKVVRLQLDEDGSRVPIVVYQGKGKKKKVSSALKPLERGVRKMARAHVRAADSYLGKHTRSNEKRRDGWLKDLASNVTNATDKGRKTFSKKSMRWPTMMKMN